MHLTDEEYQFLLDRASPVVCEAWLAFMRNGGDSEVMTAPAWLRLYELCVAAYRADWQGRWRTSEVALLAQYDGCSRPGDIAVAYTHGIFTLAVSDGQAIFGEGMLI